MNLKKQKQKKPLTEMATFRKKKETKQMEYLLKDAFKIDMQLKF